MAERASTAQPYSTVTHCIFNAFGVVSDIFPLYHEAIKKLCRSYEKEFPDHLLNFELELSEVEAAELCIQQLKLPITVEQFVEQFREILRKSLPHAQFKKGVPRLIQHLFAHDILMALTTTNDEIVDLQGGENQAVFKMFHHRVCTGTDSDVTESRPAPDVFLVAASRFPDKPKPERCLAFEFTPAGVDAAKAAGMQTVIIPDKRLPLELCKGATKRLNSLADFKPEEFGLPRYNSDL